MGKVRVLRDFSCGFTFGGGCLRAGVIGLSV